MYSFKKAKTLFSSLALFIAIGGCGTDEPQGRTKPDQANEARTVKITLDELRSMSNEELHAYAAEYSTSELLAAQLNAQQAFRPSVIP